jgi:hypothetical protein
MKLGCLLPIVGASLVAIAAEAGYSALREQHQREEIGQLRTALAAVIDEQKDCRSKLAAEVADSDKMFVWYERCLDGRTCTEATEPLVLSRKREEPPLPHMAIEQFWRAPRLEEIAPQCKGYGKPDNGELATCYHIAASMLRVRARAFTDPEVVRKTLLQANILDAEVVGMLGTVPGDKP